MLIYRQDSRLHGSAEWISSEENLARIIHKYCRALACSFVRHEYFGRCPYAMATIILPKQPLRTKARRDHHCDL